MILNLVILALVTLQRLGRAVAVARATRGRLLAQGRVRRSAAAIIR